MLFTLLTHLYAHSGLGSLFLAPCSAGPVKFSVILWQLAQLALNSASPSAAKILVVNETRAINRKAAKGLKIFLLGLIQLKRCLMWKNILLCDKNKSGY